MLGILGNTSALVRPNRIVEEAHVVTPEASELSSHGDPEDSCNLNSGARLDPQAFGTLRFRQSVWKDEHDRLRRLR